MGMDSRFTEFSGSMNGYKLEDETLLPDPNQYSSFPNGMPSAMNLDFRVVDNPLVIADPDPGNAAALSSITSMDGDSPSDDNDFSETIFNYISQMLMEDEMEQKPGMFQDPLALQAAEKSFYEVLGKNYPPPSSPNQSSSYGDQFLVDSPDDGFSSSLSDHSSNSSSSSHTTSSVDTLWNGEFGDSKSSFLQTPLPTSFIFQSTAKVSAQPSLKVQNGLTSNDSGVVGFPESGISVPSFFRESELALQFKRGLEEASKFLPKSNQLIIDLETRSFTSESKDKASKVVVKTEKEEYLPNWLKGKKNHEREDEEFEEERSNKQSAVYVDETELSDMFDRVLVCSDKCEPVCILDDDSQVQHVSNKIPQQNDRTNGSNNGKTQTKRKGNKREVVDLRTLLVLCAQAVSVDDRRTANELLKQIRQHSSPFGDGTQRLAHCFANGLEARLAGTGTQIYTALSAEKTSAVNMLKAYQAYISACPFKKIAIIFANHNIMHLAEKATTLHIIDFGIFYGFQWPPLIYRLSKRHGGPPKVRITGIELPQSGFRPAERVEETGRRLAKYCERHNVPFEYNGIAQKWETIQLEDLKIEHGEFLAVNCLCKFKNILDESVAINSPRNAVLNLIKKANPDIFVQAIVNGSYNAPFFFTRFREALFHYSALFDMLDTNMPREDQMRLKIEKDFYGREVMNVIACEGLERAERPETYKQWQVRSTRAGLKQLPLDPRLVQKLKCKLRAVYHNDFAVDEDGNWLLQGWKGRIGYASSAWVPA